LDKNYLINKKILNLNGNAMKKICFLILPMIILIGGCTKGPKLQNISQNSETITIEGDFRSVMGVMDYLSCYCVNGGYVKTESEEKDKPVCFDGLQAEFVDCAKIQVAGRLVTKKYTSGSVDPCPSGTMAYIDASSFKCK